MTASNATKRPWSATVNKASSKDFHEIIDLTSDSEEPSSKRHKSPSPARPVLKKHWLTSNVDLNGRPLHHNSKQKQRPNTLTTALKDAIASLNGKPDSEPRSSRKPSPHQATGKATPSLSTQYTKRSDVPSKSRAPAILNGRGPQTSRQKTASTIEDLDSLSLEPKFRTDREPNFELNTKKRILFNPVVSQPEQQRPLKYDLPRVDKIIFQPVQQNRPVQVNIPQQTVKARTTSQLPLSQHQVYKRESTDSSRHTPPPPPPPKRSFQVIVPPTPLSIRREKDILQRLKQGIEYIQEHADEVHKYIPHTGFALEYSTDIDAAQFTKAAQQKQRKVHRSKIKLELVEAQAGKHTTRNLIHPRAQVSSVLTDRFADESITFINDIDDKRLHGKFQFVSDYIISRGVAKQGHKVKHSGRMCQCAEGKCDSRCDCFLRQYEDVYGKGESLVQTYERRPDGKIVLSTDFIDNWSKRTEITECNVNCGCSYDCMNRVVQRGRQIRLEIFQTQDRGFGVRSPDKIVRGQFIELYLGEVLTEKELYRREQAVDEGTPSYVYSLDWFYKDSQAFHVDGGHFGSAMRFVNHSCNPNARTFTITNPSGNQRLHYLGFFAIRDIDVSTEITIDYSPGAILDEIGEVEDDSEVVRCKCGEPNCRKRLWQPGKARGRRRKAVGHELD